jgi:inorganic triphosphatase YgiF
VSGSDHVERELKLGAWPEFTLPDLDGAIDGVLPGSATERELDAVYYDTPELHLLRRGATLRFRRGEPPGDVWTAKLPSDTAGGGLARRELTVPGRRDAIPDQFAELMRGWALGRRLRPVARIRTLRRSVPLRDAAGAELATLDDDAVTVSRGRRVVARFRELEVELVGNGTPDLIAALDERLHAAGAEKVPQIPKLGRALGRAATQPWQFAEPDPGSKATLATTAHARLVGLSGELADLHAPVMLGASGSAQLAHVTALRLHAAVETYAPLFDEPLPAEIAASLTWLSVEAGALADLDAVVDRVQGDNRVGRAAARELAADAGMARTRGQRRMLRALRDRRYARLLEHLAHLSADPPPPSRAGKRRAVAGAGKFVRAHWRPLRDSAGSDPQSLAPVLGRLEAALALATSNADGEAARARVGQLLDLARDHATAVAVAARLQSLGRGRRSAAEAWAAGVVAGVQLARADVLAVRFGELCEAASQKAVWAWTE